MKLRHQNNLPAERAFTLIELLAVIAIIGIIAGLVVHLAPAVNQNKKRQRVEAEKHKLILMIDSYQAKFGFYPPDNGFAVGSVTLAGGNFTPALYDELTQVNPLLYELTGGSNNMQGGGQFTNFLGSNFMQQELTFGYGRQGIMNSDAGLQQIYRPAPAPNAYMKYPAWKSGTGFSWPPTKNAADLQGLIVPVEMVQADDPGAPAHATVTNFWHYDSSSTNRHNLGSYDLWAEFVIGRKGSDWVYVTNGNW
ncbi:MAG TPA: prepilin-type N-terminal cleavage/methylation domain-containing protein [Verrucomicrobiae bacterium]|jgi:prepilin-type N-terminal cleavage/methylation domain-containing protein|nr:prepilin-type N-terminal cleavage/methylation domain-containing protein [Verrucomicrobiae bacterium]